VTLSGFGVGDLNVSVVCWKTSLPLTFPRKAFFLLSAKKIAKVLNFWEILFRYKFSPFYSVC